MAAVNYFNAGLMVLSLALAFFLPFELFLFAYAVLGPLHYLTQISWLHDRGYFSKRRVDAVILLALSVLAMVAAISAGDPYSAVRQIAQVACVAFVTAIVMRFTSSVGMRVIVPLALLLLTMKLPASAPYLLFFGVFLTTLVHVFVFTSLFVLAGALKSRSFSGFFSFGVHLACAAACFLIKPDGLFRDASEYVRATYVSFHYLNLQLIDLLGLEPLRSVDDIFRSPSGVAAMRFIAFAYTYHYLNWFSKTKIIGWHEISRRRAAVLVAAWIGSVGLYVVDYRLGFMALFGLSMLHVFLEFPLDHATIVGLGGQLTASLRGGWATIVGSGQPTSRGR